MSLLNEVLDNTTGRARVVEKVHDANRINFVAGLSDPGEMIRCGYLPEIRRRAGEQDAEYADRIRPIVMALPQDQRDVIMKAAVRRASLDTSTGKIAVVVVGEPAWHRLGVNVASALTSSEALDLASLNWHVSKRAMSFRKEDGSYRESKDTFALVRDDVETQLGTVGGRYVQIQNAEGFAFLDGVMGEFGAKFHTAGAIFGGEKVWMQCELPRQGFEVAAGDAVQAFATFTNPHDGSGKAWCFPTTNRIVCANTFRTASKEREKGLGIRHTGDVKAAIKESRQVLGLAVEEIDQFKDAASVMARTACDAPAFFEGLLDVVMKVTAADALKGADALASAVARTEAQREFETKKFQAEIDRRKGVLDDILARYDGARCGVAGLRGTAWSAFNAVTEYADHNQPKRQVGTAEQRLSRRFESVINGDADRVKQTAYELLTVGSRT